MGRLIGSLSKFWDRIQGTLFPWLEEEIDPLTEKQQQLITILELVRIEQFIPNYCGYEGRPQKDRGAIARSFVAKMIYNVDTTTLLIERLKSDKNLRRICGWEKQSELPSESTFSRAFEEFSNTALPERVHHALIEKTLGNEIVQHNSRDSTAIESREKPIEKPKAAETSTTHEANLRSKKKGRPKKGEERFIQAPELTRVEKQRTMTLEEMLNDLPKGCDKGAKKDSKGNIMYWTGYKLHLDIYTIKMKNCFRERARAPALARIYFQLFVLAILVSIATIRNNNSRPFSCRSFSINFKRKHTSKIPAHSVADLLAIR
jgi:hypothetical protein